MSSSLLLHGSNLFIIRHDHKQSKHIHCLRRCRFSGNLATCLYKHMGDTAAAAPSRRNYSACWVNASHPPTPPPTRYKYPKVTYSGLDGMGWDGMSLPAGRDRLPLLNFIFRLISSAVDDGLNNIAIKLRSIARW